MDIMSTHGSPDISDNIQSEKRYDHLCVRACTMTPSNYREIAIFI